jgi:hypothetical protein
MPRSNTATTGNGRTLATGGLTTQAKRATARAPMVAATGASTVAATGASMVAATGASMVAAAGAITTVTATAATVAKYDNVLNNPSQQPNIQPPNQDSQMQVKAAIYNADPKYFDVKLRPEILLLSQFKPLYNSSQDDLTKEGQLFELQVSSLRNTESDANNLLKQMIGESGIKESNDKFKSQITVLRDNLQNLDSFIKKIGTYKSSLNIATDNRYKFTPGKFVETNLLNSKDVINGFYDFNASDISYDLRKALIEARSIDFKDEIDAIKLFSSSKLFLICINELNEMIKSHSYGILKDKDNITLISSSDQKYNLINLNHKRISASDLTSGITKFSDLGTNPGVTRFINIQSRVSSFSYKPSGSKISTIAAIFHICFKDLIQKVRFELNKKTSFTGNRTDVLDSFIGYYPTTENKLTDAAQTKENVFTGDKLSDLVFFGNLNNPQEKVLMLENGSSNMFPTSIASGEDYLFSSGTGNAETFLTTSTYRIDRIRDFKVFLDKISNQAFENLVDLGVVPLDDPTAASTGKGFTSLSSVKAFNELMSLMLKRKVSAQLDGKTSFSFKLITTPEVEKENKLYKGFVKGTGQIGDDFINFTDNDLIALFTYKNEPRPHSTANMCNAFYSYIYHRAVGGEESNPNFVNDVSKKIIDILFIDALNHSKHPQAVDYKPTSTSIIKKIGGLRSVWVGLVAYVLKSSVFINKIVSFFKQFLSFENLLPTFFLAIQHIIRSISPVYIASLHASFGAPGSEKNPVLTVYTHYDQRSDNEISDDLANFFLTTSSAISNEMTKTLNLTFSILNMIQTLNKNITSTLNELETFDETIPNYLLRYLNNDEKKLSILFKEAQLMLLLSTVEDTYQSYTSFSTESADKSQLFIKKEETLPHSTKIVQLLRNYFSGAEFRFNKGYNKQIISVGIPQGLLKNLNEVLKNTQSKNAKHDDIFRIVVYKMDLLNPFIIYKPKKFVFEASRFIDRVYSDIVNVDKNLAIYKKIPTRNYSLYADPNLIKEGNPYLGTDLSNTFGDEYDFLSKAEKEQILENHTTSFLLENYLRLFSGLNLNELTFNLVSPQEISAIYNSLIDTKIEEIKTFALQQTNNENRAAAIRKIYAAGAGLEKAAAIAIPDPDPYISKLLQPKRFDRVFNIIFDPEFVIDNDATTANFNNLADGKQKNDLKEKSMANLFNNKIFKKDGDVFVDVDKGPKDITMNTYFVSIETHALVVDQ